MEQKILGKTKWDLRKFKDKLLRIGETWIEDEEKFYNKQIHQENQKCEVEVLRESLDGNYIVVKLGTIVRTWEEDEYLEVTKMEEENEDYY